MFNAEKILWGEGLFLRPQHFQLQDTYHEQRLSQTIRATIPFSYGVEKIRFDETQLSTHVLALECIEMIWQDGEIYTAPSRDLLPEPVQLDDLHLRGEIQIYLALPILQANKKNVADEDARQPSRYHSYLNETHDLFTDASPAEITQLRRRAAFKLLDINSDPNHDLDGFLYLPIGKIKRQSSGSFELDYKFIPPIGVLNAKHAYLAILQPL
ncbi:hypothetical protein B9T28_12445 [Acinetobacter silvestris]|uniref:Type VI secretion system baseplate subunit TssK n=1 Tax=Acinetobacter silvestris TaxID=1977882 RepID=A0A1Y3CDT3_9GAMM|nr:hypothetical protein B9T28_12445 [Acinetobacter silvestris]